MINYELLLYSYAVALSQHETKAAHEPVVGLEYLMEVEEKEEREPGGGGWKEKVVAKFGNLIVPRIRMGAARTSEERYRACIRTLGRANLVLLVVAECHARVVLCSAVAAAVVCTVNLPFHVLSDHRLDPACLPHSSLRAPEAPRRRTGAANGPTNPARKSQPAFIAERIIDSSRIYS